MLSDAFELDANIVELCVLCENSTVEKTCRTKRIMLVKHQTLLLFEPSTHSI